MEKQVSINNQKYQNNKNNIKFKTDYQYQYKDAEDSLTDSLLTKDQQVNYDNQKQKYQDQSEDIRDNQSSSFFLKGSNNYFQKRSKSIKQKYQNRRFMLEGNNFWSLMFFNWISPLLSYGYRFQLDKDKFPILPQSKKPKVQFQRLNECFKNQLREKRVGMTLTKALAKAYKKEFLIITLFLLIFVSLSMFAPIVADYVISYIQKGNQNKDYKQATILFFSILFLTFFKILFQTHVFFQFGLLGYNMSNTLSMLIYEKSLKYPVLSQKKFTVSQIINYSQVDAQRMTYMGFQLASLLFTPIQVAIGIFLMYNFIGISFLSGFGVMIMTMSITFFLIKASVKFNQQLLTAKDERMKATSQIFQSIRFIKINAFEKYFFRKLNNKRTKQLLLNKKQLLMNIFTIFLYWLSSPLILSMTFATFTWMGNQMSATEAFTTIMLFRILQFPIRQFPTAISQVIQIWTSVKRIQIYLNASQIQNNKIKFGNNFSLFAIRIKNGTYQWGKQKQSSKDQNKEKVQNLKQNDEKKQEILKKNINQQYVTALRNINVTFQSQKFTMIIGDIGSGKSSLLFAILNQMKSNLESQVQINGTIAYVPQKPWIMSATLKENITFTLPFDQKKFQHAIKFSAMQSDIQILSKKQNTQIGQKGTNLSGGQKARVGLARALYSDRDIYLLDDIISAVDVHVGEFLMKQTILRQLKKQKKTIIMPTHAVKFAQLADQIIIMKKGQITRKGTYEYIKNTQEFKEIYNFEQKQTEKLKEKKSQSKQDSKAIEDLKKLKMEDKIIKKENITSVTEKVIQDLIMAQDHKKGAVSSQIYKQYVNLNGGIKFIIMVTFFMSSWLFFSTQANIEMEQWCQDPSQDTNYHLYIFLSFSIASSVFMLFRAYTLVIGGIKLGSTTHKKIIKALLYTSLNDFYNRVPTGRIINRLTKDMREVDQSIGYAVGNFYVSIFSLLGNLIICLYASTYLILIPIIVVAFASNQLRRYYMKTQRQTVRLQKITSSPIVSGFLSAVHGVATIRAYNVEKEFLSNQLQNIELNKRIRISSDVLQNWFSIRLSLITFLINMSSIAYCIYSSNQNPSLAGLLLTYALTLGDDIIDTIFGFSYLQTKMVSVQRISNFMKINPQNGYKQYVNEWHTKQQGYNKVINQGSIQFKNCQIRYRDDLPLVIKGISIRIQAGQKVGIVGRTGAGKSTFISALMRILDSSEGQILIDQKNIKDYFLKDLRYNLTMIDQEPTLISTSFRQNLDPRHEYNEQQLIQIVKQCNLYDIIMEKGGLQVKITNDSLSVGEKQLLCICRAFLKNSKIVLIDQATANIDQKNDQLIQEVIQTKFKNSTVLTIAHRLSTLKHCDKILVLSQGRVIEWGHPDELLKIPNGIYRQMIQKGSMANQFLK